MNSASEFKGYISNLFSDYAIQFDANRGNNTSIFYFINQINDVYENINVKKGNIITKLSNNSFEYFDEEHRIKVLVSSRNMIIMGIASIVEKE